MPFQLTEEMRAKIAEIVGAENAPKLYDEQQFALVDQQRTTAVQNMTNLQAELDKFKTATVLPAEEAVDYDKFKLWKKSGGENAKTQEEAVEQVKKALTTEFSEKFNSIEQERTFLHSELDKTLRRDRIIAEAAKLGFRDPSDAVTKLQDRVVVEITGQGNDRKVAVNVLNEDGKPAFTGEGNRMSVADAVEQLAKSKTYLLEPNRATGSGSGGGGGAATPNASLDAQIAATEEKFTKAKAAGNLSATMAAERELTELRNKKRATGGAK